ncbi:uncharacterized protein ACIBXB_013101 [Morphnus guianensis]
MVAFRIPRGGSRAKTKITALDFRIADFCLFREESHGIGPGGKRGPRKLVDTQGSNPPSSRTVQPNEQAVSQKCQEVYTDEQADPGAARSPAGRSSRSPSPAPLPGGEQAPPAARRTQCGGGGGGGEGDGGFRPGLRSSPRGLVHTLRGERRPCPGLAAGEQPQEGHRYRGTGHGEAPSGHRRGRRYCLPARPQRPLGAALRPGSLRAGARRPPPSPSARLPPSPSFLPSFLASRPFPAASLPPPAPSGARLPPCGSRYRGCPAAGASPGGPRAEAAADYRSAGDRERGARRRRRYRRSAPGSAAAAVTVCLCHVCAWAGGGAGPRRSQPADTPPSDRRRAPNQRRPPPPPPRPPARLPRRPGPLHLGRGGESSGKEKQQHWTNFKIILNFIVYEGETDPLLSLNQGKRKKKFPSSALETSSVSWVLSSAGICRQTVLKPYHISEGSILQHQTANLSVKIPNDLRANNHNNCLGTLHNVVRVLSNKQTKKAGS